MKTLTPAERLIVAADFKPSAQEACPSRWVQEEVMGLAYELRGTGACFKMNSGLRALGYDLIEKIHSLDLGVFADLKLFDIKETLSIDGALLREFQPDFVTVMCGAGVDAMRALKEALPRTEVLGVTLLTNLTEADSMAMYGRSVHDTVLRFAHMAATAQIDGLISAATEATMLRNEFGDALTINTPAIRPTWSIVARDDQNPDRIMTPAKAIKAGADRLVIGRPITQAEDPREAVRLTLEEISGALPVW